MPKKVEPELDEPERELGWYEKLRAKRIERNQAKLAELGLLGASDYKPKPKPKKKKAKAKKRSPEPGMERRSNRLSKSPTKLYQISMLYADFEQEIMVEQRAASAATKGDVQEPYRAEVCVRQVRRGVNLNRDDYSLSEEDIKNLGGISMDPEVLLSKFCEFLRHQDKISDSNERSVMRQVRKLVLGEGIRYDSAQYGWPEGKYFRKGQKITMMDDIVELMDEAVKCENKWGRDRGNGWLLSHPLKKMLIFQQFCLKNPSFLAAKCKLTEYCEAGLEDIDGEDEEETTTTTTMDAGEAEKEEVSAIDSNKNDADATSAKDSAGALKESANEHIGARVAKYFDAILFFGTITKHETFWFVEYDDGDREEFDEEEVKTALRLYEKNSAKDPQNIEPKKRKVGRKRASTGLQDSNKAVATPAKKKKKTAAEAKSGSRRSPRSVAETCS